jgi:hypothetical protein
MFPRNLFGPDGDNGENLPAPTVEVPMSGAEGEWTEEQVRGILCNPIYAGIGPFPALISDKRWIRAAAKMIAEDGEVQFLVNLLYVLRESFERR